MALPALVVVPAKAAAPWIVRMFVKYAWGPLLVAIGSLMKSRLGMFILAAFMWLGINFTTIKIIIEPALDVLTGLAETAGTGGSGSAVAMAAAQYMGIMKFDLAITMVISAIVSRNLVQSGGMRLTRAAVPGTP